MALLVAVVLARAAVAGLLVMLAAGVAVEQAVAAEAEAQVGQAGVAGRALVPVGQRLLVEAARVSPLLAAVPWLVLLEALPALALVALEVVQGPAAAGAAAAQAVGSSQEVCLCPMQWAVAQPAWCPRCAVTTCWASSQQQ